MNRVLTFRIRLIEPLLATGLEGDPNAGTGLNYIPGALLRGAAINGYTGNKCARDADFRHLFLDGSTRFLNGYPEIATAQRALPCPLSLFLDKHRPLNSHQVEDHAADGASPSSGVAWRQVAGAAPFVNLRAGNSRSVLPSRTVHVHTQRDRRKARAVSGSGAVFRYESLAAGQSFIACVICEPSRAPYITTLLEGNRCLGGSRTAGYGHVCIEPLDDPVDVDHWSESGGLAIGNRTDLRDAALRVTLLSDAVLRDHQSGQHAANLSTLVQAIAKPLNIATRTLDDVVAFLQAGVVGGFNRRWGLPLPQTAALRMGSVIVFKNVSVKKDRLQDLLASGIGERTVEGFGRVALDWQIGSPFDLKPVDRAAAQVIPAAGLEQYAALAGIGQRIKAKRIDRYVLQQALQVRPHDRFPTDSRSRLQGLRLAVLNELFLGTGAFDGSELAKRLQDIENRRTIRDKYAKIKVISNDHKYRRVIDWMKKLLSGNESVTINAPDFANTTETPVRLSSHEQHQIRLRIVAAALERLAKLTHRASSESIQP
jgi:CRISPR-associated protein Csx10